MADKTAGPQAVVGGGVPAWTALSSRCVGAVEPGPGKQGGPREGSRTEIGGTVVPDFS